MDAINIHHNMFYSCQLWTYNFFVHDCVGKQRYVYLWQETTAKKGSSEVTSCHLQDNGTRARQDPIYFASKNAFASVAYLVCHYTDNAPLSCLIVSKCIACSRHLDCGEQQKVARSTRVTEKEDWERGKETPVKSSCPLFLTADSSCGFQLSIKIVVDFPGNMIPLAFPSTSVCFTFHVGKQVP